MKTVRVQGQPSWRFRSDLVDAAVTRLGGHLAPVHFRLPYGTVQPYAIAPWAGEKISHLPPILRAMRGDFFCLPFGGNQRAYKGEHHPPHGETTSAVWKFESLRREKSDTELHLSLRTRVRRGRVDKMIRLRADETALYCRHVVSGMSGPMSPGHHATLKFPEAEGSGLIDTSPISFGQVFPGRFERPENGGYSALKPGATFSRFDQVPTVDGTLADLGRYPARRGFDDLVMLTHRAASDFAWTAVTFPAERYVWFALKDPRVLASTVAWMSNRGRHYPPWSSRHVHVMGLEDVTAYFDRGLAESATPNSFSRRGIPTHVTLKADKPFVVNYIMGVAPIPRKWGRVKAIRRESGGVVIQSTQGGERCVPLDTAFLYSDAK